MSEQQVVPETGQPAEQEYIPTICVDFDGVVHRFTEWGVVSGEPISGSIEWLVKAAMDRRCKVAIYSARSCIPEQLVYIKRWLHDCFINYYMDEGFIRNAAQILANKVLDGLDFPTEKPVARVYIDDRACRFQGRFQSVDWYLGFKAWHEKLPERNIPDYDSTNVTDIDKEQADEMLECLLDCLMTQRDGFLDFEQSAYTYVACMLRDVRENALALRQSRRPIRDVIHAALHDMEGMCLDSEEDLEEVFHHIMKEIAQSAYGEEHEDRAQS